MQCCVKNGTLVIYGYENFGNLNINDRSFFDKLLITIIINVLNLLITKNK